MPCCASFGDNSLVCWDILASLVDVLQVVWANGTRDGVPLPLHRFLGLSNVGVLPLDPKKLLVPLSIPAVQNTHAMCVCACPRHVCVSVRSVHWG